MEDVTSFLEKKYHRWRGHHRYNPSITAMRQSHLAPFTRTGREAQVPSVTAASRCPNEYCLT